MTERSIFANLIRNDDGNASAVHGPYLLQSALQPILRETGELGYELEAIEGLVRVSRDGMPIPSSDFFTLIDEEDRPMVDSLCRSLHILNTGLLGRKGVTLLVNSQPDLFDSPHAIRQEIDRMRLAAHEANLFPSSIACEIRELPGDDPDVLERFARQLHEAGFLVAIDEYAATDHDLNRLSRLRPDFLKFDPIWVHRFADNTAGVALMRVIVAQLEREGIRPIVPGVEDDAQVELCREIGMPLMQGYLLGRPQIVPTSLNLDFPEEPRRPAANPAHAAPDGTLRLAHEGRQQRTVPRFGRRIA
ncbi:EAL domain-containing protein [Rhizobium sp. ARZ01]|uniref:EAL domain-containing protein n=1 Tax=Rhizobium sp. ARZ01 TaxID=2769313 RepID=UPI00177CE246|nr:EAL domain-containing protein [Rhizobium sp. ARZ01]MBD9373256.1 EAL domain-containing protein [Rhizobium sp. ARZ01]